MAIEEEHFFPKFREVTRHNLDLACVEIEEIIPKASFIALDTEFTGLGSSRKVNAKNLDERYAGLKEVAKTRSVVSLGICTFTQLQKGLEEYSVICYNFLTLSYAESLVVEPASLEFLVNSGFSLDKLIKEGSPYILNHDPNAQHKDNNTSLLLRKVFESIIRSKKPIIVHNGLLDLMLLYQSFYNELPESIDIFLSDLSEMFEGGLYDTKEIAEYENREKASYLRYLFRKYEREQTRLKSNAQTYVSCVEALAPLEAYSSNPPPIPNHQCQKNHKRTLHPDTGKSYCEQYALHGYCPRKPGECLKSHELDFILDCEEGINIEHPVEKKLKFSSIPVKNERTFTSVHSTHSACYDAFMTGFVFAMQKLSTDCNSHKNKLYLINKLVPLTIKRSIYSSTSKAHKKSITRILGNKVFKGNGK